MATSIEQPATRPLLPEVTGFLGRTPAMLVGGRWVPAASGETFATHNPADGSVLAELPAGDREDVDRAVAAARARTLASWGSPQRARRRGPRKGTAASRGTDSSRSRHPPDFRPVAGMPDDPFDRGPHRGPAAWAPTCSQDLPLFARIITVESKGHDWQPAYSVHSRQAPGSLPSPPADSLRIRDGLAPRVGRGA
jgi:Aldehyde dehydrogenase family